MPVRSGRFVSTLLAGFAAVGLAGCETAEGFQAVAPHGLLLVQAVSAPA